VAIFEAAAPLEIAMESGGHGHFSLNATRLLRTAPAGMTNAQFVEAVRNVAGVEMETHPVLTCAPETRERAILAPIATRAGARR
jgi:hypothetical protein